MNNFSEQAASIWSIAELLRDSFKRPRYQDVILPLTVLRRSDCILHPTKEQVLAASSKLKGRPDLLASQLSSITGCDFYNTSPLDLEKLLADPPNVATLLPEYIACFSDNVREVLDRFNFSETITRLNDAGLLFLVLERFNAIDLRLEQVSYLEMGYIWDDLVRRFNETLSDNPGEHYSPRDLVQLMAALVLEPDRERVGRTVGRWTVCDPCAGSGTLLAAVRERILQMSPQAQVSLFGQESDPRALAIAQSGLYMKSPFSPDAENMALGNILSDDAHAGRRFHYLLANPPLGKEWKGEQEAVEAEAEKGFSGRFGAGLPRIGDSQLLFLEHLLGHMENVPEGGSRLAMLTNGAPLFSGDAGTGESEIRRWILENDWLEAVVALPEQLLYHTGSASYIWVLTNRKEPARRGKVQLIDATEFGSPLRKNLGDKRRELDGEQINQITEIYRSLADGACSRVLPTLDFGYRKITVERPLRLNFQATPERMVRLKDERAFSALAESKRQDPQEHAVEIEAGQKKQQEILNILASLPGDLFKDRLEFERVLAQVGAQYGVTARAWYAMPQRGQHAVPRQMAIRKAVLSALSERDATAEICRDLDGTPEPDPELRDTENVPLAEDVHAFFDRAVKPHVPDARINSDVRDEKDGEIGRVGYEINFNRYFFKYQPPRALEEIEADIRALEAEIEEMLRGVMG